MTEHDTVVEVIDDEFVPIPFAKLLADPEMAAEEMYEDFEHFQKLTRDQQGQVYRAIRKLKPKPEFKDEHKYLVEQMKEEMEYEDAEASGKLDIANDPPLFGEPGYDELEEEEFLGEGEFTELVGTSEEGEPVLIIGDVDDDVARKVSRRSCILEFYQSEPTFKKKIAASEILASRFMGEAGGEFDSRRLSVSKAIISAPELTSLMMHRRRFIKRLREFTLPGGLLTLAGGQYLVPVTFVARVKGMVDEYAEVREELLTKFEERYPDIVLDAQKKLGPLFEEEDYPEFSVIKDACSVHYRFVPNTAPEFLKSVDPELYESEDARVLDACRFTAAKIEFANRWKFLKQVEHIYDRLGADEQGNLKQLHSSVIDTFKEFLANFKVYNITDDDSLEGLITDAVNILGNNTASSIRDNGELRDKLHDGFKSLASAASKLIHKA
jgi:hypothetical protein